MSAVNLLLDDLEARMNADSYFSDITVLQENDSDSEVVIQRCLGGDTTKAAKAGACVCLLAPDLIGRPNNSSIPFHEARIIVRCFTNPTVNDGSDGTGKLVEDIAQRTWQLLHWYNAPGIASPLRVTGDDSITDLIGIACRDVTLSAFVQYSALSKCAQPSISPNGGALAEVTLASNTSGASIYYTVNGTYPWSGNTGATLYSAAFTPAAACTLRAVAHKTGYIASDANSAVFTA